MPYIDKNIRKLMNPFIAHLAKFILGRRFDEHDAGIVVYAIFSLLLALYGKGSFTVKAEALKVLEATKLEYYRRVMTPYEDKKIEEEGDIDGL